MPPDAPDLGGVPVEYLESYPLPAFVLRVRAAIDPSFYNVPSTSSRPTLLSRDTDVTVRQPLKVSAIGNSTPASSSRASTPELGDWTDVPSPVSTQPTSIASAEYHTCCDAGDDHQASSCSHKTTSTSSSTPTHATVQHLPPTSLPETSPGNPSGPSTTSSINGTSARSATSTRNAAASPSSSSPTSNRRNQLPAGPYIIPENVIVPPVSAPLTSRMTIIWSNRHAQAITKNRPLHDIVEAHTLAALQAWAEAETAYEEGDQPPIVFALEIGHPLVVLELVKTRPSGPPDSSGYCLVLLTAISAAKDPGASHKTSHDIVGPLVRAGPHAVANRIPTSHHSLILPQERDTQSLMVSKADAPRESQPIASQCHLLFETFDWSTTSIGPPSSWAPEILSMVNIAFSSFTQDCIYIGPEFNMVYNQNYSIMVDHPKSFGRPQKEVWAPLWAYLEPVMMRVWNGEPIRFENALILHQRNDRGRFVERYHSYSLIPIVDANKKVLGIYNPSQGSTARVLADRRSDTTREVVERASAARSQAAFFEAVAAGLEANAADAPFVICYSVKENKSASSVGSDPSTTTVDLQLASTVGIPTDHPCAPRRLRYSIPRTPSSGRSSFSAPPGTSPVLSSAHEPEHLPNGLNMTNSPASTNPNNLYASPTPPGNPSTPSFHSMSPNRPQPPPVENSPTPWPIARALTLRQCVVVEDCSSIIEGLPVRHWDELPDMAIVIPICSEMSAQVPAGVAIVGLNLYRPLDGPYEDWLQGMRAHLTSALTSAIAFEDDVARQLEKEKLERAKVAWFRGSAREFRIPLTLISGPLEDLQHTNLQPRQRQQLGMALKHAHRLQQLVSALLDFSRMEGGHVQANFVLTNLNSFVSEIVGMFRTALEHLQLELHVSVGATRGGHDMFSVDPDLLEMLLSNLLLISVRMTKRGCITVKLTYDDRSANIAISNSGIGVPFEELDSATDWLSRIETATSSSPDLGSSLDGIGIGLALVKEIARLHSGTLNIDTDGEVDGRPHSTTFTARIPFTTKATLPSSRNAVPRGVYARQMAEEVMLWAEETESTLPPSEKSDSAGPSRDGLIDGLMFEPTDRLLVVDSNKDLRDYIKSIFEPYCDVVDVGSVAEALRAIEDLKPDLVLSDEHMVDGKGLDLLTDIRTQSKSKLTPVVLLSAASHAESRVDAFMAGADDFLAKPFRSKELLLRVHLHMQMGKRRAKLEELFAQREQEIAVLSDYCPSGIMRTDANGNLTYANAAFLEPAGLQPGEDLNRWSTHCDPDSWASLEDTWQEIIKGDRTTTKIQWKWNTGRTMSGVFIRLDKVNPQMRGIIGCITDISYQEEKLTQAEKRRQEAEESKHQQELLVDLISHEIRTPVSAILQCSSLVKENLVALKQQLRFAGDAGFRPSAELLADLEEDVTALDSIFQCGLVQERIAGDVLSLARIQLDMLSLHDVEMNLRREARKVLSVFSSEARMKKIDIKLVFGPTLDHLRIHSVKTDPVRLGQVITNLISNAIRFTAASDVRRITVTYDVGLEPPLPGTFVHPGPRPQSYVPPMAVSPAEDTPVYLFISVRDTGPGMTPAEKDVLFQRFHQGNKMIHTRYGGSGLGLFICKKITDLLGGGIEVQSKIGEGSVFNFYIKASAVNIATMAELEPNISNSTSFSASSAEPQGSPRLSTSAPSSVGELPSPAMSLRTNSLSESPGSVRPPLGSKTSSSSSVQKTGPMHILIVEDNVINQTVLKRQILRAGLTCDVANNGQEALIAIHEAHRRSRLGDRTDYDVVLMDLEMPIMDGLTALRHIRESEATGALRKQIVIALTGNARQGQIDEAVKAGMDDVVIKPYRLPELIARMKRALAERETEEPA